KTNPRNMDTDGDGDLDGIEIAWGTDPLDPESNLAKTTNNIILIILISICLFLIYKYYKNKHINNE
ncbi:MAG: hypothetical protein OEZ01_08360, partial [Candidatus Heimdallarchaeota archaeon]|nr:hypothetical protein [Candidatus Heimdallarchaeota archaeon]